MSNSLSYSMKVKNGAGWRRFDRIRLMISVGQQYHEGEKLKAVALWINRNSSIREVHVSVNDFLQRHNNYALGLPKEQSDALALAAGALWIERNEETLSSINAPVKITRWNDWHRTAEYARAREAIDQYAEVDHLFADAINTDALKLSCRKLNRGESLPASLVTHSQNYLREELAVFAVQSLGLPAAEVYPGSNLGSAEYLLKKSLPPAIAPLSDRYFTRVDFARIDFAEANSRSERLQYS